MASPLYADAVGIGGTDTPETIGLGVGIGNPFPANPDHVEYYAGTIAQGQSIPTFHSAATGGAPASLAWYKFTSDGVSDIILDTFGTTATINFSTGSGTTLGVYDANGDLVHKQENVRADPSIEPVYLPAESNGLETFVHPTHPQLDGLVPVGNNIHNTPMNPLEPVAFARVGGPIHIEILSIAPPPGYSITSGGGAWQQIDPDPLWDPNDRRMSQIAFLKNPTPNPLWDPLHPDHDPDADWDQYPILPAGDYFIALTGFNNDRFSGHAPDMVDLTKQVGDIVFNLNPAAPDDQIPDDGSGGTVRFGFTSQHSLNGVMTLNARKPGDFDADVDTDADDIDVLFDRVAALAGQGLDPTTGVTLDGLPLNFLSVGPDNWQPDLDLSATDMVLDLTGNSRIDLGDVRMLIQNILDTAFGDANLDGVVDATDQALVQGNLNTPGGWADGDFNGDDIVDQLDLDILNGNLPGIPGDLNGDGFVGLDDLDIILQNWNQNIPPGNPLADPSGDNFVGLADLDILLNNWNAGTPPPSASNNIPEPATLSLLGLGAFALLHRRSATAPRVSA